MDRNKITEMYRRISGINKDLSDLMNEYEHIPLTLPITDEPMRKICQVLTNFG